MSETTGQTNQPQGGRKRRPLWARVSFGLAALCLLVLALVIVAAIGFYTLPSLRLPVLRYVLSALDESLPGRLEHGSASWASPGTIEVRDVRWTTDTDTLAASDRLYLQVDVSSLLHRRIRVAELSAEAVDLDVPALQGTLAELSKGKQDTTGTGPTSIPYFRTGIVPSVPAAEIDEVSLGLARVRLPGGRTLQGTARFQADVTKESGGTFVLGPLDLSVRGEETTSLGGSLSLDLGTGTADGRLDLQWEPDWSAALVLESTGPDQFHLRLVDQVRGPTEADVANTPDGSIGLDLDVTLLREGLELRRVDVNGSLQVPPPELLAERPFVPALESFPETGAIVANLETRIEMSPFAANGTVTLEPNRLIETAHVEGGFADGAWKVESFELVSRDATLRGTGSGHGEALLADLRVRLDGPAFLEPWVPEPPDIGVLEADLTARLEGIPKTPRFRLDATAKGSVAETSFEDLTIRAETPALGEQPMDFAASAFTSDVTVDLRGRLDADFSAATVAPVRVREGRKTHPTGTKGPLGDIASAGTGRVDWSNGVTLRDVRVASDFGSARVDATIDTTSRASGRARVEWSELPTFLTTRMDLRAGLIDTLRRGIRRDGPFRIDAEFDSDPARERVRVSADLLLPGLATFEAFLPESTSTEGWGPIRGNVSAHGADWTALEWSVGASADGWLDGLAGSGALKENDVRVDSLTIDTFGAHLRASGSIGDQYDLEVRADVPSLGPIRDHFPVVPDSTDAALALVLQVTGPQERPELTAHGEGAFGMPGLFVPRLVLDLARDGGPLQGSIRLPEGLVTPGAELDRVALVASSRSDSLLPLDLALSANSDDIDARTRLVLHRLEDGWRADVDTLRIRAIEQTLESQVPFQLVAHPESERYEIGGLEMRGSIGELRADGFVEPGDAKLSLVAKLELPPRPRRLSVPREAWPREVEAEIHADGPRELSALVEARGFRLRSETVADLEVRAVSAPEGIELAAFVVADSDSLLRATGLVPGSVQIYPPELSVDRGDLQFDLQANGFPVPVPSPREEVRQERLYLDGTLRVRGTTTDPELSADLRGTFPEWPAMSSIALLARSTFGSVATTSGSSPDASTNLARLETNAAVVRVSSLPESKRGSVTRGIEGDSLLVANLGIPVRVNWQPFAVEFPQDETVEGKISSTNFPLSELTPLLPSNAAASGKVNLRVAVDGKLGDPGLDGSLTARDVVVELADGSRAAASGDLKVSGTGLRPVVRGSVDVKSGVLVVPESTKSLLPVEGQSRLWEAASADSSDGASASGSESAGTASSSEPLVEKQQAEEVAKGDANAREAARSSAASNGSVSSATASNTSNDGSSMKTRSNRTASGRASSRGGRASATPSGLPEIVPDLDVTVDIPGAVWIRGRGLEVELEGNVRVTYEELPILTGTLQARSGHLRLLGRYFEVDSGIVGFYGDDDIDPNLDLSLSTRVDETTVRVDVTGTAKQPDLHLSSDPEMEEGDILSLLLLGRPLDQLDENQTNLLESRARDVAVSYGASQIGSTLSGELGVDLVSVQPTSQGTGNALVIGKYLSPRILLKYEQAIQSSADFLVNLEYLLTRRLRVETFYGRQSQSGAEINWISEY